MLIRIVPIQECDARMLRRITSARYEKIKIKNK